VTGQPLRILLLDDNPKDRAMTINALRRTFSGLKVVQIADAESFDRSLEAGDFDLALTDYQLHWTDGLTVLRAIKDARPDCPVVMITATGSEEIAVEAMKAGLDDYLVKSPRRWDHLPAAIQSAWELSRQHWALREAETWYRSVCEREAAGSLELGQVLAEIVALASKVTNSDYTSVMLLDEAGNISLRSENPSDVPSSGSHVRDEDLTNWIVRSHETIIVDAIGDDGRLIPDPGEGAPHLANPGLVAAGIRALAGLPLMIRHRLRGILYLHSLHPGAFHGQQSLLNAFTKQITIAVENARVFQAEQQQSRRLTLLAEVSRIVATTLDMNAMLQEVAESIRRHFAYPIVELFTLDDEGQTLILRGYSGIPMGPPESPALEAYSQPIGQGIIGHTARTGKSYLTDDITTDPYYKPPDGTPMRSEACIPILDGGRLVGVIDVESDRLADFDEGTRSLLEAVADIVSVGLRNARLYEESQHRLQELTLLNRISVGFGSVLNIDTLIDGALEGLRELANADRTYFITVDSDARAWERAHENVAPDIEPHIGMTGTLDNWTVEFERLLTGQPFAVFDTTFDPRVEETREMYRLLGAQSMLLAPVQFGNRLYGALGVEYCRERHAWHPDEIRLLKGMTHQLELALDNLHLFEEVQVRADELAGALARLEELDHLKDEFIQNVSHELRSPLAIVRGYVEMLRTGELGELQPEQQKPVDIIARRVRMLGDLVQDITIILEAEANPPEPEAVPLSAVAQSAVEDFQIAVEQAELNLQAEIPPGLPPVNGSFIHLRRLLDNLLSNAIKFTPAGGTITVRVRREGEHVALEVSDTGVGIPSDKLERIFERFYQVDGSTWRRFGGVGLGLALVKEIAETFGGHVTVDSEIDEGSTFSVVLPTAVDPDLGNE
jgi:signal transduction histidine kinase/CheY-like chemotaxis protein